MITAIVFIFIVLAVMVFWGLWVQYRITPLSALQGLVQQSQRWVREHRGRMAARRR